MDEQYKHPGLASHPLNSCVFDEALNVLETGLLRTPVELPTARETAILMTLAAYPLSHLGAESVNVMAYSSVTRDTRDNQKTPGSRAVTLLRRYLEFSKGSGVAHQRMKEILRASLVDKSTTEDEDKSYSTSKMAKLSRTMATNNDWDDVGLKPVDRQKDEGLDSGYRRHVIPHHGEQKLKADTLRPLLSYPKASYWSTLWNIYAYYLSCSGARSASHLSAWDTVRPLLHVIQDIIEADPIILTVFFDHHHGMTEICDSILPDRSRPVQPLFTEDDDFGPNFDQNIIDHMREESFVESMVLREKWVDILLKSLEILNAGSQAQMYLLQRFTTFAERHPQVIIRIDFGRTVPRHYAIYLVQRNLSYCTGKRTRAVLGATAFLEKVAKGLEMNVLREATGLLKDALSSAPQMELFRTHGKKYAPVLHAFYGHAQLWLKMALEDYCVTCEDALEWLQDGKTDRMMQLEMNSEDGKEELYLCEQEEELLESVVEARMELEEYMQ